MNKYFILKANTSVFSIALQENIRFDDDMIVKVGDEDIQINKEYCFAMVQLRLNNLTLSLTANKNMESFIDSANGEIFCKLSNLIKYKNE